MAAAVAYKRMSHSGSDAEQVVQPTTPSEIAAILRSPQRYPSPVRPLGSGSSTTRCLTAHGGTLLDLSRMNRVLRITGDSVTVQPGVRLPELADRLREEGLELAGGFDLATRTVGGAVCAAGLEAATSGDAGQFAAHVIKLKVLSPQGKKFEVTQRSKTLLGIIRLSYGLLGVVYEITLKVRPIRGFEVRTAKIGFGDFRKLAPRLANAGSGVKLFLLPFKDRIYLELRSPAPDAYPGRKLAWRLKDWACYSALPDAARSLARVVPIRQLRYPLIDSLSQAAHSLVNNAMMHRGSNSVEQSGRFRRLNTNDHFTYCTWAFPATKFGAIAFAYRDLCKKHYERSGFRCDMPAIGFRLIKDPSALLAPSFSEPMFTISALSTQPGSAWKDFLLELSYFAEKHEGVPFFNQTQGMTAELTTKRFGERLAFFRKARRELDPDDRMLNQYFAAYVQ